jgi:hypothetical protein
MQQRVFVSGSGSDSNPCTFAAPCRTFHYTGVNVSAGTVNSFGDNYICGDTTPVSGRQPDNGLDATSETFGGLLPGDAGPPRQLRLVRPLAP